MINKTTHYINESSLCIDVIFSSNVNLTKNFLVERTLDETCHHNIIYRTLNFNILLDVPYLREIWDYKNANIECIQKSIGLGLFKIEIATKNAKFYQKHC